MIRNRDLVSRIKYSIIMTSSLLVSKSYLSPYLSTSSVSVLLLFFTKCPNGQQCSKLCNRLILNPRPLPPVEMNILKQTIGQQKTPIKDLMKEATAQNHYFDYLPRPFVVTRSSNSILPVYF